MEHPSSHFQVEVIFDTTDSHRAMQEIEEDRKMIVNKEKLENTIKKDKNKDVILIKNMRTLCINQYHQSSIHTV